MKGLGWYLALIGGAGALAIAVTTRPLALLVLPAVAVVAGATACAARRPDWALSGCFFLVLLAATKFRTRDPLASVSGMVDTQVAMELGLYALIGLVALVSTRHNRSRRRPTWSEGALAAYVLLALASSIWSPVGLLSAVRALQLGILLLLVIVAVRVLGSEGGIRAVTVGGAAYAVLFTVITLFLPQARPPDLTLTSGRFAWFQVHPGAVGTLAASGVLLLVSRTLFPSRARLRQERTWIVLIGITFLALLLLATRSRGPLIACSASLGALALLRWGRAWTAAGISFLAIAAFVLLFFLGTSAEEVIRMAAESEAPGLVYLFRGQTAEQFASLTGRTELWKYALGVVPDNPILGHGYLSSRTELVTFGWAGYAHNGLIQSLLDFGLLGTLLVWGTALSVIAAALRARLRNGFRLSLPTAASFSLVCYLLVNSAISESFSGPPKWDVLLLFLSATVASRSSAFLRDSPSKIHG